MNELQLLEALAKHPAGIQITMLPDRVSIDLGYGDRGRYDGETLMEAAEVAAYAVSWIGEPASVYDAIDEVYRPEVERLTPTNEELRALAEHSPDARFLEDDEENPFE